MARHCPSCTNCNGEGGEVAKLFAEGTGQDPAGSEALRQALFGKHPPHNRLDQCLPAGIDAADDHPLRVEQINQDGQRLAKPGRRLLVDP